MFFLLHVTINIFILYVGKYYSYASETTLEINVGTVLFNRADNARTCWDYEGVTLLSSRYIFQNLLPEQKQIKIKNSEVVNDIVDYFSLLLNLARKSTTGRSRRLLVLALSDTIGGYLNKFVLPFARYAYYSGYIKYEDMENVYNLFSNIKNVLKTNGNGWAKAHYLNYPTYSANPLVITELKESNSSVNPCKRFTSITPLYSSAEITIPLPFTDSKQDPVSIFLPYRSRVLFSLKSKDSKNVVVKYYVSSLKCLKFLNASDANVKDFSSNFMSWLVKYVIPNLYTDIFYPSFGGVFQIIQTMKNNGVEQKEIDNYKAALQEQYKDFEEYETQTQETNLILMAVLATILIWILLGCILICCRMKSKKCQKENCKESVMSCKTETSPPTQSSATRSSSATTKKSNRSYSSSSSLEGRHRNESHRKKKKDKNNFICYMETKDGFATSQKIKSKKNAHTSSSLGDTSKASPDTNSESKIRSVQNEKSRTPDTTSFSLETFGLTSSSEKTSRKNVALNYQMETTSTTSETAEEEEDERVD